MFYFLEIITSDNITAKNHSDTMAHYEIENMDHHHEEHMSPFLPELENDTFLHLDHHLIDHNLVPNDQESNENISTIKPPSLEFDQLNHTNPFDNNTSQAFGIIPLHPNMTNENVTVDEIHTNLTSLNGKFLIYYGIIDSYNFLNLFQIYLYLPPKMFCITKTKLYLKTTESSGRNLCNWIPVITHSWTKKSKLTQQHI